MGYGLTIRVATCVGIVVIRSSTATRAAAAWHRKGMSGQHGGDDPSESREIHFDIL